MSGPPVFICYAFPKRERASPASQKQAKTAMFATTTDAPAGVEKANDPTIPAKKQTTDTAAEVTTTPLKLRQTRIEVSAGKMMREEMSIAPMMRIPTTMVIAVKKAMSML